METWISRENLNRVRVFQSSGTRHLKRLAFLKDTSQEDNAWNDSPKKQQKKKKKKKKNNVLYKKKKKKKKRKKKNIQTKSKQNQLHTNSKI